MKACVMKNLLNICLISCFSLFFSSCAPVKQNNLPETKTEIVKSQNIEPVKGRLNVYASMARAAKYNVAEFQNNLSAVLNVKQSDADKILSLSEKVNTQNELLIEASKKLDFAVLFAVTHLTDNQVFIQNYLYQKAAQQLALISIKNHQEVLFAAKKIKNLERRIATQEKIVKSLNAKLEKNGSLSQSDLDYKKSLEVSILKMQQMKDNLSDLSAHFAELLKTEKDKLHLQGKNFYELQDFDAKNQLSTFQNSALDNRIELELARNEVFAYNPQQAKIFALKNYSAAQRLDINGIDMHNDLYAQSMANDALSVSQELLAAVFSYQKETCMTQKSLDKKNAFNQLTAALFLQNELDFYMVKLADFEYAQITQKISLLRDKIKSAEKGKNLKTQTLQNILSWQLDLDNLEWKQTQVSAERAVALRALYFHAGLSPFSPKLLNENLSVIESKLKQAFNQNMVEMLAQAQKHEQMLKKSGNVWAKQDNWLEVLIDQGGKKVDDKIVISAKTMGEFEPYVDEKYNQMPILQLGSYRQKENADVEWQMLQEIYPEFSAVKPKIESTVVDGKMMYRLILKSKNGGWMKLCNKLRADKVECILRHK